ncbi:MAG: translation elongation factor Ts [Treponemataceae bacterium]
MEIKASDVKALREKTGAGMMECKNALVETEGDFAKAEKLLKEKGLAAVEKRADRATNEGKVFVKVKNGKAALVELMCETDFVARNNDFIALGDAVIERMFAKNYTDMNDELSGMVTDLATKIRENMGLKRVKVVPASDNEILMSYIHGDGKIGVVVKLRADKKEALTAESIKTFAFDIALHIAAFNPLALDRSKVDAAHIAEQEEIFRKQIQGDEKMQGKPANVIENILKGKVNKYLSDICLLDQGFVKDEKQSVSKVLIELGKQVGAKLEIADYVYFRVGA